MNESDRVAVEVWLESVRLSPESQAGKHAMNMLASFFVFKVAVIIARRIPLKYSSMVEAVGIANASCYDVIVRVANNGLRPNLYAEEFMSILVTAASNRRKDEIKFEKRDKRCGGLEKSSLGCCSDIIVDKHEKFEEYEECDRSKSLEAFLASLPDNFHRTIWKMRLEGVSVTDIAEKLERSRQWINKKIRETRYLFDDLNTL